jgi:hypothetical protein
MDPKIQDGLIALLLAVMTAYLLILGWRGIIKRRLKGRDKYIEGSQAVRAGILFAIIGVVGVATFIGFIWAVMTGRVR